MHVNSTPRIIIEVRDVGIVSPRIIIEVLAQLCLVILCRLVHFNTIHWAVSLQKTMHWEWTLGPISCMRSMGIGRKLDPGGGRKQQICMPAVCIGRLKKKEMQLLLHIVLGFSILDTHASEACSRKDIWLISGDLQNNKTTTFCLCFSDHNIRVDAHFYSGPAKLHSTSWS